MVRNVNGPEDGGSWDPCSDSCIRERETHECVVVFISTSEEAYKWYETFRCVLCSEFVQQEAMSLGSDRFLGCHSHFRQRRAPRLLTDQCQA